MTNPTLLIVIVVIAIAIITVVGIVALRRQRTQKLRGHFGPEYDRAVQDTGDRARAETELERRRKRVEGLTIRPLTREDRTRFTEGWTRVQARFVDDPKGAVTEADQLLGEVMSRRGYPVGDFEQRADDISVNHPNVVDNYRKGHAIALRHARGEASTEDLRQAMIHYRALFADLVGSREMTTAREAEYPAEKERKIIG
ncbi:hypothetical protein [Geomonas sp.]|uniref:hypothetical protein n=1 Tax=Geomonas sp. TaxID=2651584 RepID=UPI002B47BFFD|nr:hypothetical protein [Geomonas sp.]HJV35371.1 hypothetical protein [Geomonas sp.]